MMMVLMIAVASRGCLIIDDADAVEGRACLGVDPLENKALLDLDANDIAGRASYIHTYIEEALDGWTGVSRCAPPA